MSLRSITLFLIVALAPLRADAASIAVVDIWSRPAVGTGAVYATIRNTSPFPDALVAAHSPAAAATELHESTPAAMPGMTGMSGMSMHRVRAIRIPAGGVVRLQPGGYHIMLIGLRRDLAPGMHVPVVLRFRSGIVIRAVAVVRRMQ